MGGDGYVTPERGVTAFAIASGGWDDVRPTGAVEQGVELFDRGFTFAEPTKLVFVLGLGHREGSNELIVCCQGGFDDNAIGATGESGKHDKGERSAELLKSVSDRRAKLVQMLQADIAVSSDADHERQGPVPRVHDIPPPIFNE
jgi:hypothetical protein